MHRSGRRRGARAQARRAGRIEVAVGRGERAVLEIVDAEADRLLIADRADMAGDLHPVAMGLVDRGGELGRGDVHIGLGRGEAERGPVADHRPRIGGVAQRMELGDRRRRPFEIGRGEIEIGADHPPGLDLALDAEIAIGVHRSRGARGGDAAGEVERREGREHLVGDERAIGRGGAEHMLVHADQAGDDRLAAAVDLARAGGNRHRPVRAQGGDPAMIDEQGLVRPRRRAGAVDQGDMLDRDQRPALAYRIGRRRLRRLRAARQRESREAKSRNGTWRKRIIFSSPRDAMAQSFSTSTPTRCSQLWRSSASAGASGSAKAEWKQLAKSVSPSSRIRRS